MASWLGPSAFTALARVQFLVRELRSHKPHNVEKKEKSNVRFFVLCKLLWNSSAFCMGQRRPLGRCLRDQTGGKLP